MQYIYLIGAILLNSSANTVIKIYSNQNANFDNTTIKGLFGHYWPFALAVSIFGLSLLLYSSALKTLKLSVAYPIIAATSFILVGISSAIFFGDRVNNLQIFGYGLLICGILIVASFN